MTSATKEQWTQSTIKFAEKSSILAREAHFMFAKWNAKEYSVNEGKNRSRIDPGSTRQWFSFSHVPCVHCSFTK